MSEYDGGRYSRQILFQPIGPEGQARISSGRVTIIGLGALGTVIAGHMARAGTGFLKVVDRDFVELSNLQRQFLFDERDAAQRLPKAVAAAEKLRAVNSEITVEPLVADVMPDNVEDIIRGSDIVLDGTDNLETRLLINDACVKAGMPWIYGGALGSMGMTMTIVPHRTACLRCMIDQAPAAGTMPSCDTEGVLSMASATVASAQSAEALKLLAGLEPDGGILHIDVWHRDYAVFEFERRDDCPACGAGVYDYLNGSQISWTTVLCGRNAVQIVPASEQELALKDVEERLAKVGRVSFNGFLLSFEADGREIVLFPTGRAIIRGTTDEAEARSLYARYVGL